VAQAAEWGMFGNRFKLYFIGSDGLNLISAMITLKNYGNAIIRLLIMIPLFHSVHTSHFHANLNVLMHFVLAGKLTLNRRI